MEDQAHQSQYPGRFHQASLRGIQIVGYQHSGKTSLAGEILRKLAEHTIPAGYLKHAHHPLDYPPKDDSMLQHAREVQVIHTEVNIHYTRGAHQFPVLNPNLFWVVEGYKEWDIFPRIVCQRHAGETQALTKGRLLAIMDSAFLSDDVFLKILALTKPLEDQGIRVFIDHRPLSLKPFLARMLHGILDSFFANLHDREGECLTIHLTRK